MVEVALLALLSAVTGVCFAALRRRDPGPAALWTSAVVALFGAGVCNFLIEELHWVLPLGSALGVSYTALLLAGALAYAERRAPWWLLPLAFAIGAGRGMLASEGFPRLSQGLSLAVEPTAALAAAALVFRSTGERGASIAQRALAPCFLVIAALEAATALLATPGDAASPSLLAPWVVGAPIALAVQLAAAGDRVQQKLRRGREELEQRVVERTAALAQSVAELEEQVAERHAAERALRESEERYRAVSELSSDYSFAFRMDRDRSMRVEWATGALTRITGFEVEELEGEGWLRLLHPEDRDLALALAEDVLAGRAQDTEFRVVTKSGDMRWLAVRSLTTHAEEDGSVRVVGAARDVTDRIDAERERQRIDLHMRELQRLESLGVLAGGIAHDFNNVLTVILGNSRLALADLEVGVSPRERIARIQSAAEHAAALTAQMLTYSGKASVALRPLDLSRLTRDMLDLLRASVTERCHLDVDLGEGIAAIEGDSTQMRQVILNLVGNASDAVHEDGGNVCLRVGAVEADAAYLAHAFGTPDAAPGEYVFLEVSDSGDGIDREILSRVFEPFFTTKCSGRGLGLAAVLGIVSAHRGVIKIASEPGVGTTFRVLIPRSPRSAEPSAAGSPPARVSKQSGTVLVVDDDEAVLDLAREFLERSGFEVLTAAGGRAAVELFRTRGSEIDAVVLDLAMPEMGGEETFDELRGMRSDVPVVLTSGYDRVGAAERFSARGLSGFLNKPFEPEELVERVREALRRGR